MKKACIWKSHRQVVCIGRMKFRFQGKENIFSIGTYPDTTLAQARRIRDEARLNLKDGINPNEAKKQKTASWWKYPFQSTCYGMDRRSEKLLLKKRLIYVIYRYVKKTYFLL